MRRNITTLAAAFVLAGCGGAEPTPEASPAADGSPSPEPECADLTGSPAAVLTMLDFSFDPDCGIVSSDQTLSLVNEGVQRHSFTLETAGVDVDVASGETVDTEPVGELLGAGTHQYICKYHPGMDGELRVE